MHLIASYNYFLINIKMIFFSKVEGIQLEDHNSILEIERLHTNYLTEEPPPDYEGPPDYEDAIKIYKELKNKKNCNLKVDLMKVESNGKCFILNKAQL